MHRDNIAEQADPALERAVEEKAQRAAHLLRQAARDYAPVAFANSLGAEDMVITDLVWGRNDAIDIGIFSLDTGRLPVETHALIAQAEHRYGRRIELHYPERAHVEAFVGAHGIDGFYDSVAARKACCQARKVEPLRRALAGKRAWVTGLRAAQSPTREAVRPLAFDAGFELVKINPLADWSEAEVWHYLRSRGVPWNALHDRRYPSIGCAPCTRAVQPGEHVRSGRWWWESPATRECGLHVVEGRVQREGGVDAAPAP
jgi:phosphoadenosine phosphosulfate reductase